LEVGNLTVGNLAFGNLTVGNLAFGNLDAGIVTLIQCLLPGFRL
jgi:hypothetical protein